MNIIPKVLIVSLLSAILSSCQSYTPLDFDTHKILEEVNSDRLYMEDSAFSFEEAAELMSQRNLELKSLEIEYEKYRKVASLKTPLPNPELEAGPAFGSKLGDTEASSTQPFIGLGFSIPLGPRLARQDDLNKAKELQAYNEIVITHRKLYLQLREAYISYILSQQKLNALKKIEATMGITKDITKKLIQVGTSTKLGASQVELQIAELHVKVLELNKEKNLVLGKLSRLLGIDLATLAKLGMKEIKLNQAQINLQKMQQKLINNNSQLAQAEMKFHIADQILKLELAEQYPDLKFGLSVEDEVGEKKRTVSIPFAIEIPLFDRNEQQIAAAFADRDLSLAYYKKQLNEQLSHLEEALYNLYFTNEKADLIKKTIIPLSQSNIQDAEKAMKLGSIGVLRFLDMLVQHQRYKLSAIDLKKAQWQAIFNLEKISGLPLVPFTDNDSKQLKKILKPLEVKK